LSRGWLAVFAKAPRPGLVKTRMSPPLSLDECAELYAEMLADVLVASADFAGRLGLEKVLFFHPPDAVRELVHRAPAGYRLQAQHGADLAQRLARASLEAGAAGVRRLLIRGSDSPTLPFECVEEALDRLDAGADVVWTPDQGGGYALIGLRTPVPELFQVAMSTGSVLAETRARAEALGLQGASTRPALDLDTVGDFHVLRERIDDARSAEEFADLCPRTVQFLAHLSREHVL
jgi:rSAM/selenodomain-associated transferase 1